MSFREKVTLRAEVTIRAKLTLCAKVTIRAILTHSLLYYNFILFLKLLSLIHVNKNTFKSIGEFLVCAFHKEPNVLSGFDLL